MNTFNFISRFEKKQDKFRFYSNLSFITFFCFFAAVGLLGTTSVHSNSVTIKSLGLQDSLFICLMNLITSIIWLIFAPFGMPILGSIKLFTKIGGLGVSIGKNPFLTFILTLPHGIIEVYLAYCLYIFSLDVLRSLFFLFYYQTTFHIKEYIKIRLKS